MKKVAIIGGGISGLFLASLFQKYSDVDYKIFEKKKKFDFDEGYGVQLSVNSVKLLNKVGFQNLSVYDIFFPQKVNFFQANSPYKICDIDLTQFNDSQNRYTTLKRSTLLKFLVENIPNEKIKYNVTLNKLEKSIKINTYFSDGTNQNFDYIVIADGIFSKSKSIIFKETIKTKYNNSVALRGKLNEFHIRDVSIFMGSKFHYVIYPVNQNNDYNFVAIIKKKLNEKDILNKKLFESSDFLKSLKDTINEKSHLNLNNLSEIKAFPVFTSDKIQQTDQKNIFLVGDALFAFPPSFAQGASHSIETAQDIFDDIYNDKNKSYKSRISKIYSVNWRSRLNHFSFHLKNPINILLRNIALKYLSKNKRFLENYLGKIYRN